MYCTRCGVEIDDKVNFCPTCGHQARQAFPAAYPRLSRPMSDKKIAGVCAGFARYFGVDVTLVRVIALVLIFWPVPIGLVGYIIAWIVMPRDPLPLPAASQSVTVT